MIGMMERENADLSICRFHHPFFKTYVEDKVYDLSHEEELLEIYQDCYGVVMPWNRVWRASCFTQPYDEEVHFSEDELGNLANLPNVKKIVTTSKYLYNYSFAKKEGSCVNNIINTEAFWNNNTSFYFMGGTLVPKRRAIIEGAMREGKLSIQSADDMAYLRLIDYCFWQMPPYIGMGIPQEGLTEECYHIFNDPDFIAGFKAQERFGFKLKDFTQQEKREKTELFVKLCYKAYAERGSDDNFKISYLFIHLFLKLFTEPCGELNTVNHNAKYLRNMQLNTTAEAVYANQLAL
jgi:hypothetical protein